MLKRIVLCLGLTVASFGALAQTEEYSDEIDAQIWKPFSESYETNNTDLYLSLFAEDYVDVSLTSSRITHGDAWRSRMTRIFTRVAERGQTGKFTFQFTERVHSADVAFDKGFYRFEISRPDAPTRVNYGAFTVVLVKANDHWKIRLDADGAATKEEYLAAASID